MMTLSALLTGVTVTKMFQTMYGRMIVTHEVEVRGLQYDSRKVGKQEVFVAVRGTRTDGHAFIGSAIAAGASAVVMEEDSALPDSYFMHAGVVKVVVADSRKALAIMARNFHGRPDLNLMLVGVTGTNGKTTTTHLVKSVLEAAGHKVGLVGTVGYSTGEEILPATHTTPESLELCGLLATMVRSGCTAAVLEVSSHSLALNRVFGLRFAIAGFTNLTQDHLDFHGTMEAYGSAKKMLFDHLEQEAVAVINCDDSASAMMIAGTRARVLHYGVSPTADIRCANMELNISQTRMTVQHDGTQTSFTSPLVGMFNVYNSLAAFAIGRAAGIPVEFIVRGLEVVSAVPGRFERISSPQGWTAVVDYAHTPDALEKCLRTIRELLPPRGQLITVFGCGGDRDKTKRPLMGRIASELSDRVVVTSDNPRTEDPEAIIRDITEGIPGNSDVITIADRRSAIHQALAGAHKGDIVVIAGKGHETYQIIGETRVPLDDTEEVRLYINSIHE